MSINVTLNVIVNVISLTQPLITIGLVISKGEEKDFPNYSFNNNGLLSHEVIRILDGGFLAPISKVFKGDVINLEEQLFDGVFAKDILECAVNGDLRRAA